MQAYILWEQAGKPDGADFGDRARQVGRWRHRLASMRLGRWTPSVFLPVRACCNQLAPIVRP